MTYKKSQMCNRSLLTVTARFTRRAVIAFSVARDDNAVVTKATGRNALFPRRVFQGS